MNMEKLKLYTLLIPFFILAWSCKTHPSQTPMKFETIVYNEYGPEMERTEKWINTQQDFEETYRYLYQNMSSLPEFPEIDFDKNAVVFIHFGQFSYGGIHYDVKEIEAKNNELNIFLKYNGPKLGQPALTVMTNPFMLIQVPKIKPNPEVINIILED